MASETKTIETVIDLIPAPYAIYFQVAMKVFNFANNWDREDPIQNALKLLSNEIQLLRAQLAQINLRVNEVVRRVVQLENNSRIERLQVFSKDIAELQFQLSQMPADDASRGLLAYKAGAIADEFLNDFDIWQWTDLEIILRYDDYNQPLDPIIHPIQPDFKAYPALPVYLSALMTWLTAIDYHTGGNYERVQQIYGQKLRIHYQKISVTENWNELNDAPNTFPEHIMKRITCYPHAQYNYSIKGKCDFSIFCNNTMDRRITNVEGSDFSIAMPTGNTCVADSNLGLNEERIIEDERGVKALREMAEVMGRVERTGTLRQQFIGTFPVSDVQVDPSFLYGITPAGNLLWYRHDGSSKGLSIDVAGSWHGPSTVGTGWQNFKQVFVGDGNVIYGISSDGSLKWYRHDGFGNGLGLTLDGSLAPGAWAPGGGETVGTGWANFKHFFSGGKGIIYAVSDQGELLWYRHYGSRKGLSIEIPGSWDGAKRVGTGWHNFKHIFSGGDGVIYAITPDGYLKWYKHIGFEKGEAIWEGPIEVGNGWNNFSKVFSSGTHVTRNTDSDGVIIYAVTENTEFRSKVNESHNSNSHGSGKLLWYKHRGYKNGTKDWDGAKTVGSGWENFEKIFALLPGIVDVIR